MQRWLVSLFLLLSITACQSLSVSTQSDPYADFSRYQRFDWLQEQQPASAERMLLDKQFKYALERELLTKGLLKETQNPDFLISYYASQQQKSSQRTVEDTHYWGGRGRYPLYNDPRYSLDKDKWTYPPSLRAGNYTRSSETLTFEYKEGSLVIDFVDAETKQLIWQATVQGVINERDPVGQLDQAVIKALKQFPPQKPL
tara:strand:- start:296 stop:895 length:600 start_codon:yes stop_codon:yes gene_type:complete